MGWKELHPIQAEAIRQIVQGNSNLLITAQTAGGKTEAAFLPIISEIAKAPQPSIQALYIGPLKALINDQFDRLEKLCESLNIPVHRWHERQQVFDSEKRLLPQAATTQIEYDQAEASLALAKSRLEIAEATLRLAKRDLANTKLIAPMDLPLPSSED